MNVQSTSPRANHSNQTGRRGRRWLPAAGAVVLLLLIVLGMWPRPVPVETARASAGKLQATVNEEGRTRVRNRYIVSAPVTGQLRRTGLKPGAEIEEDRTVLAIIDPLPPSMLDARSRAAAEARRDAAAANLEKARASHSFAANELRRFEKLHRERTISSQELETAQWRESSAARDANAAESALRQAEAELAEFVPGGGAPASSRTPTSVKAPITGRVLRVLEESARVVAAGTPLAEVGDPADLEVVVEVLSRDGAAIVPGTPVLIEQWGGSEPLEAKVRLVEPAAFTKVSALGVEEQRVNVVADFVTPADQWRGLGHNYRVEARIVVWESDHALRVPSGALFRRGDQWHAFVAENGRARLRAVKPGRSGGAESQVIDGLKEGESVILYPGARVRDGHRIRPVKI